MLIGQDGAPLFEATVYSLVELRARNQAANTIEASLRSLLMFYLFLDFRGINLAARVKQGALLSLAEIEELARFVRQSVESAVRTCNQEAVVQAPSTIVSMERHRRSMKAGAHDEVLPATVTNRLRAIRDFVSWLSLDRLSKHAFDDQCRIRLEDSRQLVCNAINARMPSGGSYGGGNLREGLAPEVVETVLEVIDPHSSMNPWRGKHARHRNALVFHWLHLLGLRRGELLGVRISDINFQKGTVHVLRRADDPGDPRRYQPNAKTKARELPMSSGLVNMTRDYIMNQRRSLPGARKHDFLFVSSNNGAPLSIPSLNKVFSVLRRKCPDLPAELCPHVLRHTWNDRFSEEMDKNRVPEDVEKKSRSYLMGWSETSGTAATYTRRHIRKKAHEVSLAMQQDMMKAAIREE